MAKATSGVQQYPRIDNEDDKYYSFLDVSRLVQHGERIDEKLLYEIIKEGIEYANSKSARHITFETEGATAPEKEKKYKKEARSLLNYFIKYCGDPAVTAYDNFGKHFSYVANEAFRNRILQMERMNSGWRYQYIAKDIARASGRFDSVSDLNLQEADFIAVLPLGESRRDKVNIYVSVKNRSNTMGGQDWPKAITALEEVARNDRNRKGPYICVFGIAMEKATSLRTIKKNKGRKPHSINTEVWFSNFFWPFFSNYSYEEISNAVLDVLLKTEYQGSVSVGIPEQVITHFGKLCNDLHLLDEEGKFNDPKRLVNLLCGTPY